MTPSKGKYLQVLLKEANNVEDLAYSVWYDNIRGWTGLSGVDFLAAAHHGLRHDTYIKTRDEITRETNNLDVILTSPNIDL